MYNRYIPQPDGSYRRRPVIDQSPPSQKQAQPAGSERRTDNSPPGRPEERNSSPGSGQPCRPPQLHRPHPAPRPLHPQENPISAGSFLKQLLPQNLDTEDLLIVILLLLMAGDNGKEQNSALLTLALYLFL